MEAFTQIAAQLGIDVTFYYLFGLMFVLYLFLSTTYLRPFQHLLTERKVKTEGARKEAEALKSKAEEAFEHYKRRLKETHEKARQISSEHEDIARREESKIISDASAKARETLQSTQKELDSQRKTVLDALASEIKVLSEEIAAKVMGRLGSSR